MHHCSKLAKAAVARKQASKHSRQPRAGLASSVLPLTAVPCRFNHREKSAPGANETCENVVSHALRMEDTKVYRPFHARPGLPSQQGCADDSWSSTDSETRPPCSLCAPCTPHAATAPAITSLNLRACRHDSTQSTRHSGSCVVCCRRRLCLPVSWPGLSHWRLIAVGWRVLLRLK